LHGSIELRDSSNRQNVINDTQTLLTSTNITEYCSHGRLQQVSEIANVAAATADSDRLDAGQ
jgi:hypothetical protein